MSFPAHRITDDLRGEILAGGLAPGARLPSENDVAERYAHCAELAGDTARGLLWEAALGLSTRTLFGDFSISADGSQLGHDTVLVRWTAEGPVAA